MFLLDIHGMLQAFSLPEERKGALLFYNNELCHSAYEALSISYLAPEHKT